jgi:hypothetical protein
MQQQQTKTSNSYSLRFLPGLTVLLLQKLELLKSSAHIP